MFRKTIFICLLLCGIILTGTNVIAHEEGGSKLRLVQIFYGSSDVYIDDELAVPELAFTVATDYIPVEHGTHTVSVTAAGSDRESGSSVTLEVAEDHAYTILTMGAFEDGTPNLVTLDETDTFAEADPQGNNAIIVQNVPGAVPVDVWFLDELKIENLTFGSYGTASAPLGQFSARAVMAGVPDATVFESQYFAVPGTLSLAYLSGTFPDGINRTFFTTTSAHMSEYLTAHVGQEGSVLTTLYELITSAGLLDMLAGEDQYTLFAPTNKAFEALPAGTLDQLKSDPDALAAVLGYHVVEGRLTPYELTGEHSLTSVQGAALEVVFEPVVKPLNVNGIPTGLQHRPSNGVIYLIDSVLLPPES